MNGSVTLSLEDYEKLKDVAKTYESRQLSIDSEREALQRKLEFARITTTTWTFFLIDFLGIDKPLETLVEEFNKKGSAVRLELRKEEDLTYIVSIERKKEYLK